jgi:Archaeal phage integrase
MTNRTAEQRMRYAKKYYQILLSGDGHYRNAQSLLQMQGDKRIHIMKAISSLARFTGQIPAWQEIKQRYNLTWSTGNEKLDAFQRFFDDGKSLDSMLQWVRDALEILPGQMGEAIKWSTLTGLRPAESLQAIRLINDPIAFKTYYDTDRQCLQHFKFPDLFLRRTKTVYITIVDNELLTIAQNAASNPSYDRIRYACVASGGLDFHMAYCRKIYASWLRQSGIESEIVDLLQGRVPKSVFARHYFTPSLDYRDRVIRALVKLKEQIEEEQNNNLQSAY